MLWAACLNEQKLRNKLKSVQQVSKAKVHLFNVEVYLAIKKIVSNSICPDTPRSIRHIFKQEKSDNYMCKKFKQYIFPKDTHGNALEKSLPKIYTKPMV